MQKYGLMANNAAPQEFTCQVCEATNPGFQWSELHGEGMCLKCGTPYQLIQYEGEGSERKRIDAPPRINLTDGWIPVCKTYFKETGAFMGLGQIVIARDYPECVEGLRKLDEWCEQHQELLPKTWMRSGKSSEPSAA